jgi:hypothetical protein
MMTAISEVHVQGLKKRIQFIARIFPLREGVRAGLKGAGVGPEERVYEFVEALWRWSGRSLHGDGGRKKAWERITKSDMLPSDLLKGLCNMYLGLPEEALVAESFKEFADLIRPRWRAYNDFKLATDFYEKSRPLLQSQMLAYYRSRSSNPDLALITGKGWIPEEPILMTGNEGSGPELRFEIDDTGQGVVFPTVPGLEEPLHEARRVFNSQSKMHNGETYRPLDVHVGVDGLRITCGPGRYFDYHDTCEILGVELGAWMRVHRNRQLQNDGSDLPLRKRVDDIFNLRNRCAVLGVSTLLIALDRKGQGRYFWHRRDPNVVAVNPGAFSVVPSGTFQPFTSNFGSYPDDFSITATIVREFAEELLGMEDFNEAGMQAIPIEEEAKVLLPFLKQLDAGKAKIHFLGIGIDPVTTVPEVMTVMTFREDFLEEKVKAIFKDNFEGKYGSATLSKDALQIFSTQPNVHSASSACASLVARHYDQLVLGLRSKRAA